jgi:hypothetical protein
MKLSWQANPLKIRMGAALRADAKGWLELILPQCAGLSKSDYLQSLLTIILTKLFLL